MTKKAATTEKSWPNIQGLIDNGGNISIGAIRPIRCAAVATDEDNMLAALLRRKDETLTDLLDRLDQAIEKAIDEEIFTDEINS
jgi:hypothetical protein